jgi:3'-phosphoadenosine 5'-phosphosulfate sulfotransferase (PAPS reductase)/FAD synthetase
MDKKLENVCVVYSDTGWAAEYWEERVVKAEDWCLSNGFRVARTSCEGMAELIKRKKAWPRGGGGKFQFCTETLKKEPARKWLDEADPDKEATCLNGVRRLESRNRISAPEWTEESEGHGGRELWSPLVRHTEETRNELIAKTPFAVLPYKSKECWPCVNAGKRELKHLEPERVDLIDRMETEAGINSKGNARVMFSPRRHNGAIGIRAVIEDAQKGMDEMLPISICSSGWCN